MAKIFANVLNLDIDLLETEEGPGYGGAILAVVACGEYASVDRKSTRLNTTHPDPALSARYEAQYQKFRQIYPAMKALFPILQ